MNCLFSLSNKIYSVCVLRKIVRKASLVMSVTSAGVSMSTGERRICTLCCGTIHSSWRVGVFSDKVSSRPGQPGTWLIAHYLKRLKLGGQRHGPVLQSPRARLWASHWISHIPLSHLMHTVVCSIHLLTFVFYHYILYPLASSHVSSFPCTWFKIGPQGPE